MKIKKAAAIFLAVILSITMAAAPVRAEEFSGNPVTAEEIEAAMKRISAAAETLKELEGAGDIAKTFDEFMNYVRYAGISFSAVNGGITFLKLIGVIKDPVKSGISNILSQLSTVNDKLNEMDSKLNSLASQMTEMQASEEFHYRGTKALSLNAAWREFENWYMEEGCSKLMSQYNGMLMNGIKAWCRNTSSDSRRGLDIDNTQIVLIYLKNDAGVTLPLYSIENGLPEGLPQDASYVILGDACLPEAFTFRAESYQTDLAADLAKRIRAALDAGNYAAFESRNMPMFTEEGREGISDEKIAALSADAVSVLLYRIAAAEVNRDSAFTENVSRQFENYCSHVSAANEGVDAVLKNFFLTHAFEFEVSEDVKAFLDRMLLLTGTYGNFTANVLGMSDTASESMRQQAMASLCRTTKFLEDTKENSLTGRKNYCYIVNGELVYTQAKVWADALVHTERIYRDKENYKYYKASPIRVTAMDLKDGTYSMLGDVNMLLLAETLRSEGYEDSLHEYFNHYLGKDHIGSYDAILTSFGGEANMPLDGTVVMKPFTVIGNDFAGMKSFRLTGNEDDYPDDADPEYILYHKKISGSVYDMNSGKLSTNQVLLASAVYGQTHSYWFKDEAVIFAGPSEAPHFFADLYSSNDGKFDYDDDLVIDRWFNFLAVIPLEPSLHDAKDDPLSRYKALSEEMGTELNYMANGEPLPSFDDPADDPVLPTDSDLAVYVMGGAALIAAAAAVIIVLKKHRMKQSEGK